MYRWINKVAVVTGTSSGIGAAVAKQLVDAKLMVVGLSRRKDRGEKLAKELNRETRQFHPLVIDVTKGENVSYAFDWVKNNLGPVHILVNCAGVKKSTTLIDGDINMWKETLDTNVLALCMMTREAIKNMRANDVDGHIVHINSVAGHVVPRMSDLNVYAASKHAVTALTETLRQELNAIGSNIKVTSISPSYVKTEMLTEKCISGIQRIKNLAALEPEDVANAVMFTLSTPPHVQVQEILLKPLQLNKK